jgi:ABC-type spermidine/putrescine transport system permease subunit I
MSAKKPSITAERRRQRLLAALSFPALAVLALLFAYPVLRLMALSVEGGSLEWYGKALGESLYLEVYWITIRIAIIVTMTTLLLSYPIGYFLATTTRLRAAFGPT